MRVPEGTKFVTPDGFEVCVLCLEKANPPILFSTHIDARIGYIEGSGQTCANTTLCEERQNKRTVSRRQEP